MPVHICTPDVSLDWSTFVLGFICKIIYMGYHKFPLFKFPKAPSNNSKSGQFGTMDHVGTTPPPHLPSAPFPLPSLQGGGSRDCGVDKTVGDNWMTFGAHTYNEAPNHLSPSFYIHWVGSLWLKSTGKGQWQGVHGIKDWMNGTYTEIIETCGKIPLPFDDNCLSLLTITWSKKLPSTK